MTNEPSTRIGTTVQRVYRGTDGISDIEIGRCGTFGNGGGAALWPHAKGAKTAARAASTARYNARYGMILANARKLAEARRLAASRSLTRRQMEMRSLYPEKWKARAAVNYQIKIGKIVRPKNCQGCSVECFPQAHHNDYLKPLDVIFLCKTCHKKADRQRTST